MRDRIVQYGKYPLIFIGVIICFYLLKVFAYMIPTSALTQQAQESADYFMENDIFAKKSDVFADLIQDNYTDCILLDIAYSADSTHPFEASLTDRYHQEEIQNINDAFQELVADTNTDANTNYSRYWHGSLIFIRPLMCFLSITGIRIVGVTVLAILFGIALFMLVKSGNKELAIIYAAAMLPMKIWMVFSCVQYLIMFILLQVVMIVLVWQINKNKGKYQATGINIPFLLAGMCTAYFDFLTAETLTYTIPFFFLICIFIKNEQLQEGMKKFTIFLSTGLCWVLGYAGTFLAKWMGVSAISDDISFSDALQSATYRISGEVSASGIYGDTPVDLTERVLVLLSRNIGAYLHLPGNMSVGVIFLIFFGSLAALFAIWYLFHKKTPKATEVLLLMIPVLLVYIRFLLLSNHSYIHYFYTYRAQMPLLCFILWMFMNSGIIKKKSKKSQKD